MSNRTIELDQRTYDYMRAVSLREPEVLARLRAESAALAEGGIGSAPEQGQLLAFLAAAMGARRALEIGTFCGYGALWVALALPEDGRLVTCDMSAEWTDIGRRYWREAGVEDKIELRLGPALETLDALLAEGAADSFDFAFIDADKKQYDAYFERTLALVRPGGLIALDNVLWRGRVADPAHQENSTKALRALNLKLRDDARVDLALVPVGDGMTLARRRA